MRGAQGHVDDDTRYEEADAGSECNSTAGTLRNCGDEGRLEHLVSAGVVREIETCEGGVKRKPGG